MSKIEQTKSREWKSGKADYRLIARYGFEYLQGNSAAHFHVIGDLWERRSGRGRWPVEPFECGQLTDRILKAFPKMATLTRWHLCDTENGPMHYAANALFWWEKAAGESRFEPRAYDPDPIAAFKSTIVFGALPEDEAFDLTPSKGRSEEIAAWLAERLPKLMAQFRADIEAAGFSWEAAQALKG